MRPVVERVPGRIPCARSIFAGRSTRRRRRSSTASRSSATTITYESCIREQIVLAPGQVFNRNYLIRSYQNIGNLNFFETPMAAPETRPSGDQGDVDIVFNVKEKRTGNVNFGASMGQGTGVGGFIGLDQPNLLGRCKRAQLQWQFGQYINDFNATYTDPNIRQSRISGSVTAYNTQSRFQFADLGRATRTGGQIQFGFPVPNSLYSGSSSPTAARRSSTATTGLLEHRRQRVHELLPIDARASRPRTTRESGFRSRPRRIADLQRAVQRRTAGWHRGVPAVHDRAAFVRAHRSHRRQPAGRRADGDRASGSRRAPERCSATPGPFFYSQAFSLGGTQYGEPLRGYDEFSITPNGYDPARTRRQAKRLVVRQCVLRGNAELGLEAESIAVLQHLLRRRQRLEHSRANSIPTRLFRSAGIRSELH